MLSTGHMGEQRTDTQEQWTMTVTVNRFILQSKVGIATWQDITCTLYRGDVHSSSELDSSIAVNIANTGTWHSYDHQVWQLGSLLAPPLLLYTSDVVLWQDLQVISSSDSEMNN